MEGGPRCSPPRLILLFPSHFFSHSCSTAAWRVVVLRAVAPAAALHVRLKSSLARRCFTCKTTSQMPTNRDKYASVTGAAASLFPPRAGGGCASSPTGLLFFHDISICPPPDPCPSPLCCFPHNPSPAARAAAVVSPPPTVSACPMAAAGGGGTLFEARPVCLNRWGQPPAWA